MSFLKNILGAFVEFKEEEAGAEKEANLQTIPDKKISEVNGGTSSANNTGGTTSISGTTTSSPASAINPSINAAPEYKKHFEDLIEEANAKNPLFQGTDIKEFIESKTDVEAITDEETRYKTSFNVLKRTGLTKEKLVTTGQAYIKIIENDLKAFENAYNQQYRSDVEQKEQLLQQKAQELQLLNEKILTLNQEMKQMSEEVIQGKEKLSANKNLFIAAGESKKKEIETELQKINQYFS